MYLQAAEAVM